ncbi:hypothetical protein [Aphanothece stagnina]|uniref:hypothetical protein n=1 Tax=Aphanothece stagnina TaxID=1004305 RepID=UPI00398EECC1
MPPSPPPADAPEASAPCEASAPRETSKKRRSLSQRLRQAHAALAPVVLLPLLLTVSTGLGYRLLRDWGGLGRDQAHGLMVLHEGEWLRQWFGPNGETLYVLLNGLGLLWMLVSGGGMAVQKLRRSWGRPRG